MSDVHDQHDMTLYEDDTEDATDSINQRDSGENYKGIQKQDPEITESTPSRHSHESDDSTGQVVMTRNEHQQMAASARSAIR